MTGPEALAQVVLAAADRRPVEPERASELAKYVATLEADRELLRAYGRYLGGSECSCFGCREESSELLALDDRGQELAREVG